MGGSTNAALTDRIGTLIGGKYRLVRVLGAGGMGAVFEAVNSWTEGRVAIKVMLGSGHVDGELTARFMREARATTKVAHENIVRILDMGQDPADGALYIVQEFLDGTELRTLLDQRGALPPQEAIEILAPVMSALIAAHRHGIVHRDLKPENIFLTRSTSGSTVPKLIDFGIAKMESDGLAAGLTKTGASMGTPHFMSPEQARGERNIDAQTDVWAVGVMLFEMLSGAYPFDADNYNALMIKIAMEPPRRIEEIAPRISPNLAAVVHRALERDRTARFRSMQEFLGALLDCGAVADDEWNRNLRSTVREAVALPLLGTATPSRPSMPEPLPVRASRKESTFGEGPGWVPSVIPNNTLGQSAREVYRPAVRSPRSWTAGGIAALVVGAVVVVAVGVLARSNNATSVARPVAPPATRLEPPATSTPSTPTSSTFAVNVTAQPISASITLDGTDTGSNALSRELPRDGVEHILRVSADGFEPFTIAFVDAPPPREVNLVSRGVQEHRSAATNVRLTAVSSSPQPRVTSPRLSGARRGNIGANSAPIVEE